MKSCVLTAAIWLLSCTGADPGYEPAATEAPETLGDLGAVPPADLKEDRDLAAGPADLGTDLAAAAGPEECALPLMTALYPGGLPPNPYGPLPMADACVRRRHDAIGGNGAAIDGSIEEGELAVLSCLGARLGACSKAGKPGRVHSDWHRR